MKSTNQVKSTNVNQVWKLNPLKLINHSKMHHLFQIKRNQKINEIITIKRIYKWWKYHAKMWKVDKEEKLSKSSDLECYNIIPYLKASLVKNHKTKGSKSKLSFLYNVTMGT